MTRDVIVPSKRSDEKIPVSFPFGDQLQFGETISGQAVTCVVYTGEDASPSAVLYGAPSLSGSVVTQVVQAGVPGTIYQLVCVVTASGGHTYSKNAKLAIANAPDTFIGI